MGAGGTHKSQKGVRKFAISKMAKNQFFKWQKTEYFRKIDLPI